MAPREGYDVLRLIEHGQICYISSEYIYGTTLVRQLKCQKQMSKQQLFLWLQEITRQLELIHRCRGNPCYQYVNPYSIIVSETGKIYFLDLQAGSNKEMLRVMQKREIREYFLPLQEKYYQKSSVKMDIYGLGRTIQYLLSQVRPEPPLNRREEIKIQKIISKCLKWQSKKSYQNVSEIRKQIPEYSPQKEKYPIPKMKRRLLLTAGILVLAAAGKYAAYAGNQEEAVAEPEKVLEASLVSETEEKEEDGKQMALEYVTLALAYFLDVEDYDKSLECLTKAKGRVSWAEDLKAVVEKISGKEQEETMEEYQEHLRALEEQMPETQADQYERCLIKGYGLLDTEEAAAKIIQFGESCLKRERIEEQVAAEVKEAMISACEKLGQNEEAARLCGELLDTELLQGKKEELYKRTVMLYEKCGRTDLALDICTQGVKEIGDSMELKILQIRIQCEEESIGREICAQTIREYLKQQPEILETEEFRKLQKEYEIQVEGEEVWVGR